MNSHQLAAFRKAASTLPAVALSLSNSAGIYLGKNYHFNMVRPGAALYGLSVTDKPQKHTPVVSLSAPILQMRSIAAGQSVGYEAQFIAKRDTRTITISAGYGDGIPVAASGKGYGTLNGQRLPIIGRVSMDLTVLDATDYKGTINMRDRILFYGDYLEAQASAMGALNYELLTRLGGRLQRRYSK